MRQKSIAARNLKLPKHQDLCLATHVCAGARTINPDDIPEDVTPESINPLGNYAVQILWQDGFNQVRYCSTISHVDAEGSRR